MRRLICLAIFLAALPLFAQSAAGPLSLKLHHASASVGDLNRAIKWYQEKLGFKVAMRRQLNPDAEIAWMTNGDLRIDLIQRKGSVKPPAQKDHMLVQSWGHIVFAVPDADRAYAILKARGVALPEPVATNEALHIRSSHFPDSEGNWLEIYEDTSAPGKK